MLDLYQRVSAGLRSLTDRAPVDVDVWPAAERYVAVHRRRRLATVSAVVTAVALSVAVASAVAVRATHETRSVANPGPTVTSLLPAQGPVDGSFTIKAQAAIRFAPSSLSVPTGVYAVTLENEGPGQHTLDFADPETLWSPIDVTARGETKTARVFFGRPGDYSFFCAIPGHRAAGEVGVVHVTGSPITVSEAEERASHRSARE